MKLCTQDLSLFDGKAGNAIGGGAISVVDNSTLMMSRYHVEACETEGVRMSALDVMSNWHISIEN